jgi:hypothetical protein
VCVWGGGEGGREFPLMHKLIICLVDVAVSAVIVPCHAGRSLLAECNTRTPRHTKNIRHSQAMPKLCLTTARFVCLFCG